MSYKIQNFKDGDTLTAENLINIENAILSLEKSLPVNYAIPYTQWDWKEGLEGIDVKANSFNITNTKDTSGVFGIRLKLTDLPFEIGDTMYVGIKDFYKDAGNFSLIFLNGATELKRVNATVTSPITYLTSVIPDETTDIQIRMHGSTWAAMSGGKFYISQIEFDENTNFTTPPQNSSNNTTSSNSQNTEIYISPNGDDTAEGTYIAPMKTIKNALKKSNRITMFGGVYSKENIYIGDYTYPEIFIRGIEAQRVIINCGSNILVNDGSEQLVEGYTKVYQYECPTCPCSNGAFSYRLYQDYVNDVTTLIPEKDRHALQRGREYRCDSTVIRQIYNTSSSPSFSDKKTALDKIEALEENSYGFYWDNGIMYFSRPLPSSEENPIIMPIRDDRFIDQNLSRSKKRQCRVVLNNIEVRYANIHLAYASNNECSDVLVKYPYVSNGGGFYLYETSNCKLTKCEACGVTNGTTTGDGFNVDTKGDTLSDDNALCCSVIMDNCWSHDNNDDGYSDHDRSEVIIRGGLFEYCGKGGLTPAYGSNDIIENVVCRYNRGAGILSTGAPASPVSRKYTTVNAIGCLCYGQEAGYRTTSGCLLHAINCVAYDNDTADFDASAGHIYTYGCLTGSSTKTKGNVSNIPGLSILS